MEPLRYALSTLFVVSVAAGLLLFAWQEAAGRAGVDPGAQSSLASRPATWFTCAAVLFVAIIGLTIAFPVAR